MNPCIDVDAFDDKTSNGIGTVRVVNSSFMSRKLSSQRDQLLNIPTPVHNSYRAVTTTPQR
jgi:hypothetical protein